MRKPVVVLVMFINLLLPKRTPEYITPYLFGLSTYSGCLSSFAVTTPLGSVILQGLTMGLDTMSPLLFVLFIPLKIAACHSLQLDFGVPLGIDGVHRSISLRK